MVRRFDIVMVTDARLPGGTSASVAEEIRAQAAAGYRTALLQADSPLVRRPRPMSPRLRSSLERGEFELLLGDEPVDADLLVLRHPTVARSIDPANVPAVTATHRLLVANQAPGTPAGPEATDDQGLRYEPAEVSAHLQDWLGGPVEWVPIGPLVRSDLQAAAPDLRQQPDDWVNVIDVNAWRRPRDGALHRIPVIGRHSRDHAMKWPATREEVLRVYPDRDDVEVHVLGGEGRLAALFGGRTPANWVVHPFGSMPPERFLAGIDVYVYYHHPAWVEAFGRNIMEALASGAPTVLPEHFRPLFEDAALYAAPDEVEGLVRAVHGDRARYREAGERATAFVEDRFGHATHLRRLERLAEPTGTPLGRVAVAVTSDRADAPIAASRRRVLFVSSNGAGVGHLMRLMALAKHAPDDIEPLFLTFSQGAKVVDDTGHLVEYLASRSISGAASTRWHPMLRERVNELIERYDVRAMVFDGTWPYRGLLEAATDQPQVGLVWSRRAMWRPGISNPVLDLETDRFDLVIEPGEFADDEDRGATRRHRADAVRVGPVSYLSSDELLDAEAARAELGLEPDRPAALVNLGAGNINDVSSLLGRVVDRLAQEPELQVCVTRSIIADRTAALPDNVRTISVYPLARYLPAFDLAFAASGYNSYHELVAAGVPTAFVPNLDTSTDDQAARSRFAHRVGVGIDLLDPTAEAVDAAVCQLMDPDRRRRMHERAVARRQENGAPRAMQAIADLVERGPGGRMGASAGSAGPVPATAPAASSSSEPAAPSGPQPASEPVARSPSPRGRPPRSLRGWVRSVAARELRPLVARVQAGGRVRAIVLRGFHRLPAPTRKLVRRAVTSVEPPRPQVSKPSGATALPVPIGNVLAAGTTGKLPRIAIVLPVTADSTTITALVDHVAQLQAASRSFAPLFVTSDVDFRPLRRYGYLFEYIPGPDRWDRVANDDPWAAARQQRLTSILRWFAITSVVTLPEPGDDGIAGLRSLLSAVIAGVADR